MVLFISNDLFFQPQVQQAAQSGGIALVTRANLTAGQQWLDDHSDQDLQAIIVDLKAAPDPAVLTTFYQSAVAKSNGNLKSIAYGPHVKVDLLQSAQDAGFDQVLTQGQFHREARNIVQQMAR